MLIHIIRAQQLELSLKFWDINTNVLESSTTVLNCLSTHYKSTITTLDSFGYDRGISTLKFSKIKNFYRMELFQMINSLHFKSVEKKRFEKTKRIVLLFLRIVVTLSKKC